MSAGPELLIEIGTEELPPKALGGLSSEFSRGILEGLEKMSLLPQHHEHYHSFATPRRLAVLVSGVSTSQPDSAEKRTGPRCPKYDDKGNPSKAAEGFARSCGVTLDQLLVEDERLVCHIERKGRTIEELLPPLIDDALGALPIPRRMRWGTSSAEFVRPVHWVVILLDEKVIETEILGVSADRCTRGHRFHHPDAIPIPSARDYASLLESRGHVIPDYAVRKEMIRTGTLDAARQLGGEAIIGEPLLDEVTALVEWPVVFSASYDSKFLDIPSETLISSMQVHQKCFPVAADNGKLMPNFIAVANIDSADMRQVRAGNERVMHPRLADAAFFWEQDRKTPLYERVEELGGVIFQKQLGTLRDKAQRISDLAGTIAERLGSDPGNARRAGLLCKCDLLTDMVGEFPELQGVMGRYYAGNDGEPDEVCRAIDEQYMPRYAGDALPESIAGQAVAIADKTDTLVGIFGIGQIPTGNKDPFALRRAALGVLRILIERELDVDLEALLNEAARSHGPVISADCVPAVFDFMMERLRGYYLDAGIPYDSFEAVLACRPLNPVDFDRRVRAVSEFRNRLESGSLAAANKRIRNILKKTDESIPDDVDRSIMIEQAEKHLAEQLSAFGDEVEPLFAAHDYTPALARLTGLRGPVDSFFDDVMVMTDDPALRRNRLALLSKLSNLFLRVADISRLEQ